MGSPPVRTARSSSTRLRRSPNSGVTTATEVSDAAPLVRDERLQRVALDHLGDHEQRPARLRDLIEHAA